MAPAPCPRARSRTLLVAVAATWVARARRQVALTEVKNLSDDAYRSPAGAPLGIRIAFDVRFPTRGYRLLDVSLAPDDEYFQAIRPRIPDRAYGPGPVVMRVVARRVVPAPQGPVPGGG